MQSQPSYSHLVACGKYGIPVHLYTVLNLEKLFCKYFTKVHMMEKKALEVL
jgi:hypothetical protein